MRVELDQRQWPVPGGMGAQQRVADEVIATEGQHLRAGLEDPGGMRLDRAGDAARVVRVQPGVAPVDHPQRLERVEAPGKGVELRCLGTGGADRAGAHPAARAVRGRAVPWHAADHHVGVGRVAAVAAAQEAQRPGIAHLGPSPACLLLAESLVAAFVHLTLAPVREAFEAQQSHGAAGFASPARPVSW